MVTIGLNEDERSHIFSLIFGILHLGNVIFDEQKNDEAYVRMEDRKCIQKLYTDAFCMISFRTFKDAKVD